MTDDTKDLRELEDSIAAALDSGDEANLEAALSKAQGIETASAPETSSNENSEGNDADDTATPGDDDTAATGDEPAGAQGSQPEKGNDTAAAAQDPAKDGEGKGASTGGDAEEEPAPIADKSGRGTIPYQVLKDTREQLGMAKAQIAKLSEQLQSRPQEQGGDGDGGQQGGTTDREKAAASAMQEALSSGDDLSEEDLEDLPVPMQQLYKRTQALEKRLNQIGSVTDEVVEDRQKSAQQLAQEAIDQVPDLATWQAKGGVLWAAAREQDRQLQADPEWGSKPAVERFAEVARRVRADVGLPESKPDPEPTPKGEAAQQGERGKHADGGAASGRADASASARAAEPPGFQPPPSMSQMPGGGSPDLDKFDSIERASPSALAERMADMSDDQIYRLLAEFA